MRKKTLWLSYLALIILCAAWTCFAEESDVLATGSQLNNTADSAQPAVNNQPSAPNTSPAPENTTYREDWFNWSDAVNFDDIKKNDKLQF